MVGEKLVQRLDNLLVEWYGIIAEKARTAGPERYEIPLAYKFARQLFKENLLSAATPGTLEGFMRDLPRALKNIEDASGPEFSKEQEFPVVGVFISAMCASLPFTEYTISTESIHRKMGFTIDYLFYRFPHLSHRVAIDGPIGNDCFYQAKVYAEVKGKAGHRNATGFVDGSLVFIETGDHTAEGIEAGHVKIVRAGNNVALKGKGGTAIIDYAGDNLGKGNRGTTIIVRYNAGANVGKGMLFGVIYVQGEHGPNLGADMRGGDIWLRNPPRDEKILHPPGKTGGRIITDYIG